MAVSGYAVCSPVELFIIIVYFILRVKKSDAV